MSDGRLSDHTKSTSTSTSSITSTSTSTRSSSRGGRDEAEGIPQVAKSGPANALVERVARLRRYAAFSEC
jgi:hypothetical protein